MHITWVVVLAAWLLLGAGQAHAARLTAITLGHDAEVTRLVLQADSTLEFRVELAGPQTVELLLPGARLAAKVPDQGQGLVAGLRLEQRSDGPAILLETTRPGVTVLPIYDAPRRRLTLELGGKPGQEETLPAPTATPEATPTPAPEQVTPRVSAESAPSAEAAAPQPPAPAAAPPMVSAVRVVSHQNFTRLLVRADKPIAAAFETDGQTGWLRLASGGMAADALLGAPDQRVTSLGVIRRSPLILRLQLAKPVQRHRLFAAEDGRVAVLDLDLDGPKEQSPTRQPMPTPPQAAPTAAPTAMPMPTAMPTAMPTPMPTPTPPAPAATPSPSARLEQRARELARNMPVPAAAAQVDDREPYLARGPMPPLPTPPALARPRQAVQPATPASGPAQAPSAHDTAQVLAKVRQAREGAAATAMPTEHVPPEPVAAQPSVQPSAQEMEKNRQQQVVEALLAKGRGALENRDYNQALLAFQELLDRYPKDAAAGEAAYRLADAFYYLHEREMPAFFHQVLFNYQRAIDLYPKSDQVPWALLMMGKASLAFGEPFRGMGYFQIVIDDYPKSEYVPLALVNRGRSLELQGKFALAQAEYERVLAQFPKSEYSVDAHWGLAKAYFGMARFRSAADVLQKLSAEHPQMHLRDPELLYYLGEAEFQLREYAKARFYFLWALNIKPDIRDGDIIMTRVADSYGYQGQLQAAREIYAQVVETYPDTDGALVSRIRLAEAPEKDTDHPWDIFQVKADVDAFRTYKEIAERFPDRQVGQLAKVKLAVYHYKMKEYDKAIGTLEKMLQVYPTTPFRPEIDYTLNLAAVGLLENLRAQNKPMELMEAYLRNRVLLTRPNSNQMLTLLAWAYESTGLYDRAAGLYKVLTGRGLVDPKIWLAWAENLAKGGQYKEAAEVLKDTDMAALKGAEATRAQSLYGRMLLRDGQSAKAAEVLAPLLKGSPSHAGAENDYRALGQALANLGRHEEAMAAFERATALLTPMKGPEIDLERYLLAMEAGASAIMVGKNDACITLFATAESLAQSPVDKAQAMYELARAYLRVGDLKRMEEVLKELEKMQLTPWSEMAKGMLDDQKLAKRLVQVGK